MKNVILYALGFLVISAAAQAAPRLPAQAASRVSTKRSAAAADRQAVITARVKLMNDVRKLGPDAPQVAADKEALIQALAKLQANSKATNGESRPVNVKRNPKKVGPKHMARGKRSHKTQKGMAAKIRAPRSPRKISHRPTRKHTRLA